MRILLLDERRGLELALPTSIDVALALGQRLGSPRAAESIGHLGALIDTILRAYLQLPQGAVTAPATFGDALGNIFLALPNGGVELLGSVGERVA